MAGKDSLEKADLFLWEDFPGEVMRWWLKKNLLFEEKNR